jgi:hypothetical protein
VFAWRSPRRDQSFLAAGRGCVMNAQSKDGKMVRRNMPTPAAPDESMPPCWQVRLHLQVALGEVEDDWGGEADGVDAV